jgi:hypothetical protein
MALLSICLLGELIGVSTPLVLDDFGFRLINHIPSFLCNNSPQELRSLTDRHEVLNIRESHTTKFVIVCATFWHPAPTHISVMHLVV